MRGAAAERSAKITLMEDGVLIAPAPYSAPAAYYFPLVTRMSRGRRDEGPVGDPVRPNTVGGAVDLISAPMAERGPATSISRSAAATPTASSTCAPPSAGDGWGVQGEYVGLRTDGWKQLDGGGDTGFDKDDASLWLAAERPSPTASTCAPGTRTRRSDETYLGLTDADLAADRSDRRYRATADDQMNWSHVRLRADCRRALSSAGAARGHRVPPRLRAGGSKVDGFVGERDLDAVLSAPDAGAHPIFYAVLTGAADSTRAPRKS
jgi:Fe(3+) dicitrate transport protein